MVLFIHVVTLVFLLWFHSSPAFTSSPSKELLLHLQEVLICGRTIDGHDLQDNYMFECFFIVQYFTEKYNYSCFLIPSNHVISYYFYVTEQCNIICYFTEYSHVDYINAFNKTFNLCGYNCSMRHT